MLCLMFKITHTAFALFLASFVALSGCAGQENIVESSAGPELGKLESEKPRSQFSDIPFPAEASIDFDNTMVFGANEKWLGRLALDSSLSANDLFDFFKTQSPGYGWSEIASIRSSVSVLTYSRQDRIATIQIESAILRGSVATITVTPRSGNKSPGYAQQVPSF